MEYWVIFLVASLDLGVRFFFGIGILNFVFTFNLLDYLVGVGKYKDFPQAFIIFSIPFHLFIIKDNPFQLFHT